MKKNQTLALILIVSMTIAVFNSCSKSDSPPPVTDSGIIISLSSLPSSACTSDGTITVSTKGSTSGTTFEYKLDDAATFATSSELISVAAGEHTITVKNNLGISKTEKITVATKPLGSQFTEIKSLLSNKCAPCHTTKSEGAFNIVNQCNIIEKSDRIVARAITTGDMPKLSPLTVAEKKIISDWITGGGKESN
jgi:uncharacterized membrane protein